jgi:flagellar protein FlaG
VNIQPTTNISHQAGSPAAASPAPAPAAPAKPAGGPAAPAADASLEQLTKAVKAVNKSLENQSIEFSLDETDHRPIIKVVDQQTKEVIRQIPSKEMLEIARALDKAQGLLIDHKA